MMKRRNFLQTLFLSAGILCCGITTEIFAEEKKKEQITPEIMKKTLYAKTKKEEAYIEDVYQLYEKRIITQKIFYGAYQYALRKKNTTRMIYFSKSLEALCRMSKLNIKFKSF